MIEFMRIVGLIPARGGSKGVPRKNLQIVGGHPLVARKILQAIESMCNEVWVTTDDSEISDVSLAYGAQVITRPADLALDTSGTDEVVMHASKELELAADDVLVLLQPTSPLLNLNSLNQAVEKLLSNSDLNSVITIKAGHPFLWSQEENLKWNPDGHSRLHRPRRQELPSSGWETGGCYAIRASAIYSQQIRYPEPTGIIPVSFLESVDLDTQEDLDLVRNLIDSYPKRMEIS
jgi:CMP-N-acetylneuraminic acid synthetase